jgi:uncharacterized protein YutE (UPF0331/DUF86 family)/predicted nucleotidyltransferase
MSPGDARSLSLEQRLQALAGAWSHDRRLAAVYLFGSRARGDARADSDVDLAVILDEHHPGDLTVRLELAADAARRLATDAVDVVVLEEAPPVRAHRVLRDGKLLVDSRPSRRVQVVEECLRRYLDTAPLRSTLDRALAARVREGALPVDAQVVRRRLRRLERCLRVLRTLRRLGRDAFVRDEALQDRLERNVELAAQACIDIALHLVAAIGTAAPDTYASAILELGKSGVVSDALAQRLAQVARLRNILVHDYLDVDHGRLFDELGWLDEAADYGEHVERWLQAQGLAP